jgi:hypothetical protein
MNVYKPSVKAIWERYILKFRKVIDRDGEADCGVEGAPAPAPAPAATPSPASASPGASQQPVTP